MRNGTPALFANCEEKSHEDFRKKAIACEPTILITSHGVHDIIGDLGEVLIVANLPLFFLTNAAKRGGKACSKNQNGLSFFFDIDQNGLS